MSKIVSQFDLREMYLRIHGYRHVVLTNGCFDLLHYGHVSTLQWAKKQGDMLVVAVNSDTSIKEIKGPSRPVIPEKWRMELVAALECVDNVILMTDITPHRIIRDLRPDVLVKSGEYTIEKVIGHEIVLAYGGEVLIAPYLNELGTTRIINRIRGLQ